MLNRVLDRYFLRETITLFILFLSCFFALFVLIDYTSRSSAFHLQPLELVSYYWHLFIRRIEVLVPFALLVAVVRILCQANARYELAAAMACGIPLRRLLRGLMVLGLVITALLYLNTEIWLPHSLTALRQIEDAYAAKLNKKEQLTSIHGLRMADGSHFIYSYYDSAQERFIDSYWVRTLDDIYRIRYLYPLSHPPVGEAVEHLWRNAQGELVLAGTDDSHVMNDMHFEKGALSDALTPPSDRSMSSLWEKLPMNAQIKDVQEAQVEAAFLRKAVMPWLALLACLAPLPLCARFRRPVPTFWIYCISLTGIVLAYLWISAGSILAKSQVLSPWWGLAVPAVVVVAISVWRFYRLR